MKRQYPEAKTLELLQAWRDEPIEGSLIGVHDQRQLQHVAKTLRRVAEHRRSRPRWRRLASALAVAAAVFGVALGGWMLSRESVQPAARAAAALGGVRLSELEGALRVFDAAGQALAPGAALGVGAGLETQAGAATLGFPSGASVRAAGATRIAIQSAGLERKEALSLARGLVEVEVPRLAQPVEFSVQTPDAQVVVHGTHFSVQVDPDAQAGTQTHVVVTRGLVSVAAHGEQSWVKAGEQWPAAVERASVEPTDGAAAADPAPHSPAPDLDAERPRSSRRPRGAAPNARAAQGSLAAENRIFAAAMAKHKAGDLSGALELIDRLIARYPDSLLLQEARVERFRLLQRLGRRAEAAREARSYLGDYHDGYAREEARGIALENP